MQIPFIPFTASAFAAARNPRIAPDGDANPAPKA